MELNQPIETIACARTPHRHRRGPYQRHPTRASFRQSLISLVPSWQSSSVSLTCPQIPPLNFGDNVVWHEGPIISVIPTSERGSLLSRHTSVVSIANGSASDFQSSASIASRNHVSTQSLHSGVLGPSGSMRLLQQTSSDSRDNASTRSFRSQQTSFTIPTSITSGLPHMPTLQRGHQGTQQSSALNTFTASGSSPLEVALTTRMSGYIWKSGVQPRVISNATMEGLIHYLLLKSAGERVQPISRQ